MEPKDYTNHSGGAKGADLEWDRIGREFGVTNHKHYRPSDLENVSPETLEQIKTDVKNAAKALGRPDFFKGIELVYRNWFQVEYSTAIYAITRIIEPGEKDFKGFENKTGKQIVAGGTGWAVEMAIQKHRVVYVFDMNTNKWNVWDYSSSKFLPIDWIPALAKNFAGIGSREVTIKGTMAIAEIYEETFHMLMKK